MDYAVRALMNASGVKFGTSGARGKVSAMTDEVCYAYTRSFLQYLQEINELEQGASVALAGDLRPSTDRIMSAVAKAILDMDCCPVNCGPVPSPTVAYYGMQRKIPAIMVTGSHIPADRNGIKFNKAGGEILKEDEIGIIGQTVSIPDNLFDEEGQFLEDPKSLSLLDPVSRREYVQRFKDVFPPNALEGMRIGYYQHSAVGRETVAFVFHELGAKVVKLGFSEEFVPVDTEAVRPEDVELARKWAAEHELDAILSTDGDSDRPLISDEHGEWLRGDIVGILTAQYLEADSVAVPVSCNTALERVNSFDDIRRCRIGSPYVIAAMNEAAAVGFTRVVGYEANGGFLTHNDMTVNGSLLPALPTRDAALPMVCVLLMARKLGLTVSELRNTLPGRFTASDRIKEFPQEKSAAILERFSDSKAIELAFGDLCGPLRECDQTDGLRMFFKNGDIIHLRPSGNAPEFRCYVETGRRSRTPALLKNAMTILEDLKD